MSHKDSNGLIYDFSLFDIMDEEEKKETTCELKWNIKGNYIKEKRLISHYLVKPDSEEDIKELDKLNGSNITYIFGCLEQNLYIFYIHIGDFTRYFFQSDRAIIGLDFLREEMGKWCFGYKWQFPACAITWFNSDGTLMKEYLGKSKMFQNIDGTNYSRTYDFRDDIILGDWKLREYGEYIHYGKATEKEIKNGCFCEYYFTLEDLTRYFHSE